MAKTGTAIINADDAFAKKWLKDVADFKHLTFGIKSASDVMAHQIEGRSFELELKPLKERRKIELKLLGRHNILNALAASAAAVAAGESITTIQKGLERLEAVQGRLQVVKLKENVQLVNDAYNANPNSLKAGIDACNAGVRWLVLGDMRELGKEEIAIHQECGLYAKEAGFSKLFALGELTKASVTGFGAGAISFEDHQSLLEELRAAIDAYDDSTLLTILLKGSNSMNMQYFYEALLREREYRDDE